jgi:hypothetical protein
MDEIAFRTTPYFERLVRKVLPKGAKEVFDGTEED